MSRSATCRGGSPLGYRRIGIQEGGCDCYDSYPLQEDPGGGVRFRRGPVMSIIIIQVSPLGGRRVGIQEGAYFCQHSNSLQEDARGLGYRRGANWCTMSVPAGRGSPAEWQMIQNQNTLFRRSLFIDAAV